MRWLNSNTIFYNEPYQPRERYDVVVFVKAMNEFCQEEVKKIKKYAGKVIFDANVNYYEVWGNYGIPQTKPSPQQQADAIWMTEEADYVVADSSYLLEVVKKFNPRVAWIPDNVNLKIFKFKKMFNTHNKIRLVWSGVAKKAQHLLEISSVLGSLKGIELVLVSSEPPEVMDSLERIAPCAFKYFTLKEYAKVLSGCDIIISPKRLDNGYEMAHSEYKITPGMAVGLPAVASPQQSYVEAISYKGGGFIARTEEEWSGALQKLASDYTLRKKMGLLARETVEERYSTDVVARQYLGILEFLLREKEGVT